MTGEQLFLRYAFPCAQGRLVRRKLDEAHFAELAELAQNGGQPPRALFRYCFPYAFRRLREYASENGLERWAPETVRTFWRSRHGHRGECRVRRGQVVGVDGLKVVVACEGERLNVINFYRLPIREGSQAYFHFRVIAEAEEAA